jgi:hypothetical protein
MDAIQFEGQQTGERILAELHPHPLMPTIKLAAYSIGIVLFVVFLLLISFLAGPLAFLLQIGAFALGLVAIAFLLYLNHAWLSRTKTYITDRRIIRFEMLSPVFVAKRALFWNEVLKTKSYTTNLILRLSRIGTVKVEPHLQEGESIIISDVYYFDDIANYIDKILYLSKNAPADLASVKPFVFAARGKRD